ncbi:MAG: YggT family protein [Dethiobacteria bacterium]
MYILLILGRIILSWFQSSFYDYPLLYNIFRFCYLLTEPLMAPLRRLIPPVRVGMGLMDLSPLILWFLLLLAQQLVERIFL